ncbi:hypothetical protein V5O48_017839 [Marasmius crinis-equi]|uniref:Uncharacterized protein n=1 Tax=Marasmius crinis-equi TaxID=585013 RepID=A0ABR3EMW3_9AGAR
MSKPQPIPIPSRDRSASVSSSEGPRTPSPQSPPRVTIPSPGSSPILSYFLAQSPTSKNTTAATATTFPFRKFTSTTAPVFEEEPTGEEPHSARHARRASTTVADRFNSAQPVPSSGFDRGHGLLRRLSLSTATAPPPTGRSPPAPPPPSAVTPSNQGVPFYSADRDTSGGVGVGRVKRSNTLAVDTPKTRRAPSPMGERILKGHFDGFN